MKSNTTEYTAADIEVLEGLEPVRKRPGMYIGGVDSNAMHHLVSEVLDNAMDEAVAGFASVIEVYLMSDRRIAIKDNGRGIPVDPHPKFPNKSALEVILTTLHSGAKFSTKAYQTAGGLHGVGVSVVNALSSVLSVSICRNGSLYTQEYSRGVPISELTSKLHKGRSFTSIAFEPDEEIFGENTHFDMSKIYDMLKSKAYLFRGVVINWKVAKDLYDSASESIKKTTPQQAEVCFPNGIVDYLKSKISSSPEDSNALIFSGNVENKDTSNETANLKVEWAVGWPVDNAFSSSYCNTIPTPLGGTHEQAIKNAMLKSIREYLEKTNNKKSSTIIADDILGSAAIVISIFISEPIFQGQTKDKLLSQGVVRPVENLIKDHLDNWLVSNKNSAAAIIDAILQNAEYRISRKAEKVSRKTAVQKLRLPGKLADCTREISQGTELFLVEGDSAGGSAKQARNRETQAVLPLQGKILNVASSTIDKIIQNKEISALEIALACGSGKKYNHDALRYEKVIIMTDADIDGAHIASLLMTFFFKYMPQLIHKGHLYLAVPPLYRISQGNNISYADSDEHKEKIIEKLSKKSREKIEIGRFKGLGEMTPAQLKETTMNPEKRKIIRVHISNQQDVEQIVEDLMGKKADKRAIFIKQMIAENHNISDIIDV